MAEDYDTDSCEGFKRRISEPNSSIEGHKQTVEELHSKFLSLEQQSSGIVSTSKEVRETVRTSDSISESFNGLQKKPNCSSSDEFGANDFVQEKQETVHCDLGLVSEGVKMKQEIVEDKLVFGLLSSQLGFSSFQEFREVHKGSTSGLSVKVPMDSLLADCDKRIGTSYNIAVDENESEALLENKENLCLVGPEVESISVAKTHVLNIADFDGIKIKETSDDSSRFDGMLGIKGSIDTDERGNICEEMQKMVQSVGEAIRCSLKIEVIDETALIDTASDSMVGNRDGNGKGFRGLAKDCERNGNKKNMKQVMDGNEKGFMGLAKDSGRIGNEKNVKQVGEGKEKRSRRRGKGGKSVSGTIGKEKCFRDMGESQIGFEKKGDESKRVYPRKEMEAMRFVNVKEQKKKWIDVYSGLGLGVAKEYDGLVECNNQKHIRVNFDPRQRFGRKEQPSAILGDGDIDGCMVVDEECDEDDDSDEDYSSIQRPAFFVAGEPDFSSGPPEDGLEYLRRVRWEASQIPKVKVARLERSKVDKEQTVYMPQIPDIAKCPEHLLPMRQWEDVFLADFSELRLAFSRLEGSNTNVSDQQQSLFPLYEEENSLQLQEGTLLKICNNLTTKGIESCEAIDSSIPENSTFSTCEENESVPKSFANGSNTSNGPTLSVILKVDSVVRILMLRKRISALEAASALSRNDCEWLFGLCVVVDAPLDADTCASLRCLLRKCASLRAGKSELDDEVVMLNILAAISGRYFGQSEKI